MNVVFAYLGTKIPKYFVQNLKYFRSTFPEIPLCVVIDDVPNAKKLEKLGFTTYLVREEVRESCDELALKLNHDMKFRSGFWMKTVGRFLALQDLMEQSNLEDVIHVEGDLLCLPKFPFEKFEYLPRGLAFPLETPDLGIASILYIKNFAAVESLCDFTKKEIERDPRTTDMRVLGRYAKVHENEVFLLPTFSCSGQVNPRYEASSVLNIIVNDESIFQGIFDSVSLGQYLFGVDPKNNRGLVKKFFIDDNHLVDPSKFNFLEKGGSIEVLDSKGDIKKLFSLHIHSKELAAFRYPLNTKLILKNYRKSKSGVVFKVKISVMLTQTYKSLIRRASVFK
jgi:hypothetical protein